MNELSLHVHSMSVHYSTYMCFVSIGYRRWMYDKHPKVMDGTILLVGSSDMCKSIPI